MCYDQTSHHLVRVVGTIYWMTSVPLSDTFEENEPLIPEDDDVVAPVVSSSPVSHPLPPTKKAHGWCVRHKREVIIGVVVGIVVGILLAIPAAFLVDPIREAVKTRPTVETFAASDVTFFGARLTGFVDTHGLEKLFWCFRYGHDPSDMLHASNWVKLSEVGGPQECEISLATLVSGKFCFVLVVMELDGNEVKQWRENITTLHDVHIVNYVVI
jgi:hypothetical protein